MAHIRCLEFVTPLQLGNETIFKSTYFHCNYIFYLSYQIDLVNFLPSRLSYFIESFREFTRPEEGFIPISSRMDRSSATKTIDVGLIPDQVKSKTIKSGLHSFPA